jgi:hypothetical protein
MMSITGPGVSVNSLQMLRCAGIRSETFGAARGCSLHGGRVQFYARVAANRRTHHPQPGRCDAVRAEHEARPGIDRRDEVLHAIEPARNQEEAHAAAHLFLRWLEELELVE